MPIDTWGLIPKAQDDAQTINEAIAAGIAAHEADSESHLGVGESLETHRASEVIDHLEESIVNDKIGPQQITPEQISASKYYIMPTLESLDGWVQSKVGTGADIIPYVGYVEIVSGVAVGNKTKLYMAANGMIANGANPALFPIFQCVAVIADYDSCDAGWGCAAHDMIANNDRFGFRWDYSAQKLYACVKKGASAEEKIEITGITIDSANYYKIIVSDNQYSFDFYVNYVLKCTIVVANYNYGTDYIMSFTIGNRVVSYSRTMYISNPVFIQNH